MNKIVPSNSFWRTGMFVREAGQALDRLGTWMQGSVGYKETCKNISHQERKANSFIFYFVLFFDFSLDSFFFIFAPVLFPHQVNRHRRVVPFKSYVPVIGKQVFVAPSAHVIGAVHLSDAVSIWYNAVIRGDVEKITVGTKTNIQDRAIVHVSGHTKKMPTSIGDNVTIGKKKKFPYQSIAFAFFQEDKEGLKKTTNHMILSLRGYLKKKKKKRKRSNHPRLHDRKFFCNWCWGNYPR